MFYNSFIQYLVPFMVAPPMLASSHNLHSVPGPLHDSSHITCFFPTLAETKKRRWYIWCNWLYLHQNISQKLNNCSMLRHMHYTKNEKFKRLRKVEALCSCSKENVWFHVAMKIWWCYAFSSHFPDTVSTVHQCISLRSFQWALHWNIQLRQINAWS